METLDWIVIGLFCLALVGIIVWVMSQKQDDSKDYFLGGRDATWIAIGASIFASNIGSEHLIGLAGAGASSGMAMAHWEIQGWMILILGWVFVPFYSRSMVYTMPEFLERRYNPQSRTILSLISLISYVLTKVAVTVYAGGLVFQQVFGIDTLWGIDFFWIAAIGLVVITALYTIFGGMKSVLYTSVLQTPILLLGSLIILVLGFRELGGWDEMMRICSNVTVNDYGDSMTDLIRSNSDPDFPWLGALVGSSIIGFWYWCTDQYIVQRVLSGKNQREARRGSIFGAYLKLLPVFLFLIPGMMEHVERAGIHSGDSISVYPPQSLKQKVQATIIDYTGRLARALKVVGLMNIQFVIYNDEVYIIEVNPRSSRTVPYISKVTGVPMVDLAVRCMLGERLRDLGYGTGLYPSGEYCAVKVPVFSFSKLHNVDTQLGPEMKSTGEVLGIAKNFEDALIKGLVGAGYQMRKPSEGKCCVLTVKDSDKPELTAIASDLKAMGYKLYGTLGTADHLNYNMVPCSHVRKLSEEHPNLQDLLESGKVDYVISTSSKGRIPTADSVKLRRKAVELSIPCLTAIDTANVLVRCLKSGKTLRDVDIIDIADILK